VFISGPDAMVRETARMLARRMSSEHVHHDPAGSPRATCPPGTAPG